MQRPCSRNLRQTIAASPLSSGSTICTERIEPGEEFIFGKTVRLRSVSIPTRWKSTIAQRYGAPEISFYDTSVIVENVDQKASAA
jgi:hypothetical protein